MNAVDLFNQLKRALTLAVSEAEKEAMIYWLLEHRLQVGPTVVRSGKDVAVKPADFTDTINRLNAAEPLQYILGVAEFYGRTFEVNPSVLIPRPETELIISKTLELMGREHIHRVLDIGTGSGCIATILAIELPHAEIIATDVSENALQVARANATNNHVSIQFLKHDILREDLLFENLDVIVSNPPYIPERDKKNMERNVTAYEPHRALFVPDADPLIFHRALATKSIRVLRPGGLLICEINASLGKESKEVFNLAGFPNTAIIQDLDQKDRFVTGFTPS
ncbi:MAG: peptide chain release factor N(5)-glutamine methyltransferase [Cytophagales bacterium]|nr:peptide chain release factor N(5)-glutamine methyltransferase [Cytophagales bacterium]